jgi:hypothetical protein
MFSLFGLIVAAYLVLSKYFRKYLSFSYVCVCVRAHVCVHACTCVCVCAHVCVYENSIGTIVISKEFFFSISLRNLLNIVAEWLLFLLLF